MTFQLGLRLAVAGGQESLLRLALTAFGVAVGVMLLLLCLTGQSAEQGRAERSRWQSADPDTPATALSRVQAGPLATSRHGRRPPPSARRALPLAAGIGGLLATAPLRRVVDSEIRENLDTLAPLFVILTIIGFVTIGPWLCMLAGRGIARVSRRVPGLIAARRIASDPSATFRAVSVVVVAAFAVTCSASLVDASEDGSF